VDIESASDERLGEPSPCADGVVHEENAIRLPHCLRDTAEPRGCHIAPSGRARGADLGSDRDLLHTRRPPVAFDRRRWQNNAEQERIRFSSNLLKLTTIVRQ
jgi:hypothetical protein